jgi:membrane peptidoglycan carboxypeptidase
MLEEVVYDGTGKGAFIKGLRIAGKTGTAMKYDPVLGQYVKDKFVSSFIGFFPAENPQMLVYVMIDNPKHDHLGGKVAAPTFKKILQRILRFIDIVPNTNIYYVESEKSDDNEIAEKSYEQPIFPDLTNRRLETACEIAKQLGLLLVVENSGDVIAKQRLEFKHKKNKTPRLIVTLKKLNEKNNKYTLVPVVKGLGLREALAKMSQHKLRVIAEGSGIVVGQNPEAGSKMRVGSRCVLECRPAVDLAQFASW